MVLNLDLFHPPCHAALYIHLGPQAKGLDTHDTTPTFNHTYIMCDVCTLASCTREIRNYITLSQRVFCTNRFHSDPKQRHTQIHTAHKTHSSVPPLSVMVAHVRIPLRSDVKQFH